MKIADDIIAIDIETTGTVPGAGIWQIGVYNGPQRFLNLSVLVPAKALIDPDTMKWIEKQPEVHRAYMRSQENGMPLSNALRMVQDFLRKRNAHERGACVVASWGNFDMPLLRYWFEDKLEGEKLPWHYGNELDMRSVASWISLVNQSEPIRPKPNNPHDALSDAIALRRLMIEMLEAPESKFTYEV